MIIALIGYDSETSDMIKKISTFSDGLYKIKTEKEPLPWATISQEFEKTSDLSVANTMQMQVISSCFSKLKDHVSKLAGFTKETELENFYLAPAYNPNLNRLQSQCCIAVFVKGIYLGAIECKTINENKQYKAIAEFYPVDVANIDSSLFPVKF